MSRLPFLVAVALFAAAIGDALVETLANSGLFGRGYDDNDHTSVVPVLVAGAFLTAVILIERCRSSFGTAARFRRGDWVVDAAKCLAASSPWRDIPFVLVMQFGALFAMESVEQISLTGRLSGGAIWLGGPIGLSLIVHIAIGCAMALGLASLVRSLLRTLGAIVRDAIDAFILLTARCSERASFNRRDEASVARVEAPHIRQLGGRAPPLLPLAA